MNFTLSSQSNRLGWALFLSLLFSFQLLSKPIFVLFSPHEPQTHILPLLRAFGALVFGCFVVFHLLLFRCHYVNDGTKRIQFSMLHLLICTLGASVIIGANFIPDRDPMNDLLYKHIPVEIDPTIYGFPFEILREYRVNDTLANSIRSQLNPIGILINAVVLLLFMANILVLRFRTSETKRD